MGAAGSSMSEDLVQLELAERLSPLVFRVLGCNPGEFELQGTNTYLVGSGTEVILIDASDVGNRRYQCLLRNVLKEQGFTVTQILITHWHHDHIGGVRGLVGSSVLPRLPLSKLRRRKDKDDESLAPAGFNFVQDGHVFKVPGATLRAADVSPPFSRNAEPSISALHFLQQTPFVRSGGGLPSVLARVDSALRRGAVATAALPRGAVASSPGLSVQASPRGPPSPGPVVPVLSTPGLVLPPLPNTRPLPSRREVGPVAPLPTDPPPTEFGFKASPSLKEIKAEILKAAEDFVRSADKTMPSPVFDYDWQLEVSPDAYYAPGQEPTTEPPVFVSDVDIVNLNVNPMLLNPPAVVQVAQVHGRPQIVNLDVIPQLLSPALLHSVVGINLWPEVLDLDINPQILSPTIATRLLGANIRPQLLRENFQPNVLSPSLLFEGAHIDVSPRLVTQQIAPCLLGGQIHMALLKASFNPDVAVSEISPALLCPSIFFQLLKMNYSPEIAKHDFSPKELSPTLDMSLLEF